MAKPGNPDLAEQIRRVNQMSHLSEAERDRLIGEVLKQYATQKGSSGAGNIGGYLISILLPPLGYFIGGHYLLRYGEERLKPAIICMVLTTVSLVVQILLFRKILASLLSSFSFPSVP
ncbi:MAG: hypothetical protein COX46_00585 [bacterium (Candidatus Ratteibacteria) CG23_combo_of_CG06-09_8_20_14_all_48_7]|uniref:Uncharacterized protein n=1 Tax=bacterium (Candidatus Ratteibacteria) CG23_combo_of_CG06-09_8_20_14_all_48_7 TaxID=2014292 RepID=A0A2G9YBV6_9BACT|nr:MAG: hypothetical protein COX46_00585 [bacterium (Candidatus Ratteibacteria) CG23_combo_of_CG06-09_8_20_14_all_48_7]